MVQREQRKSRRFLMQLPIIVRWADENLVEETATETQDVSSGGLRFHLPKAPKSGSALEILMTLPYQAPLCRGRSVFVVVAVWCAPAPKVRTK